MKKREAFRRIRKEIGAEICPLVSDVLERNPKMSTQDRKQLNAVRFTTDQLRNALATLIVWASESDLERCPNCDHRLPEHNHKCVLNRLLID